MNLIDTHCHLDYPDFDKDRETILRSCQNLGVEKIIVPGVFQKDWPRLIRSCEHYEHLFPALGIHPCFLECHELSAIEALAEQLQNNPGIVAIGETGLDFYLEQYDQTRQQQYFVRQMELAQQFGLPLILHVRKAHDQVSSLLKKKGFNQGGIVHCYSGSLQQARKYLELGFKLGIGGVVTYPRSKRLRAIVADLPLDSFVLETDAPDIPLYGIERQRNTPENLVQIFETFADLRGESTEELQSGLYHNTMDLFPRLTK